MSAIQLGALLQTPLVVSHWRLQQSVATPHELPDPLQVVTDDAQVCATGSQDCEQHCAFDVQAAPATLQMAPSPPVLPAPPWPPVAPFPPVPVLMAFTELLPQPGRTKSAVSSSAKIAATEIEVGEGFILVRATADAKRLTTLLWRILAASVSRSESSMALY